MARMLRGYFQPEEAAMIRSEHFEFAAMLFPTLVLFIAMAVVVVVPEDSAALAAAGPETEDVAVTPTEWDRPGQYSFVSIASSGSASSR